MRRRLFSSFKSRMMAASIAPIILLSVAASLNSAVSSANIRRVSALFSLDIFMKEMLADVDSVVSNLAVYIDTKNTDALRAYMHEAKILSAKSTELTGGPSYRQDSILEQNLSVLIRRLIVESEAAIRAKRGRNIPEYGARYQEVTQIASFIHDRASALSLERLELNLDAFSELARESGRAGFLLAAMLTSAMIFATAIVARYSLKLVEPLESLASAAVRISDGDFAGGPLPASDGDDEIAKTSRAFNVMQASIVAYIGEIQKKAAIEASLMEERLKNLEMTGHLRSAELKALQSRINPHFLFNTLNTGIQLATIEDADDTRVFLERLAGLMRYSFRDLETPVQLRDELACLRDYIYIMSIRFPESVRYDIRIDPDAENAIIPKMIIQPLVENAIKHGLAEAQGRICVSARLEDGDIVIAIEDNGRGIAQDRIDEILAAVDAGHDLQSAEGGLGLANVISRLRLFADTTDVVRFEPAHPGTRVLLRVPFREAC